MKAASDILNLTACLLAVVPVCLLVAFANLHTNGTITLCLKRFSFRDSPGTAVATPSLGVSFLMLALVYAYKKACQATLSEPNGNLILVVHDVANVALLISGLAIARGREFSTRPIWPWGLIGLLLLLWDFFLVPSKETDALFLMTGIAPSAVLSIVSLVYFGWVFVVRWGAWALPYLGLLLIYSLLQLPAYAAVFFGEQLKTAIYGHIFLALAILKFPLILGFFAFMMSEEPPSFEKAQHWPDGNHKPNTRMFGPLFAIVSFITTTAAVALIHAFVTRWIDH